MSAGVPVGVAIGVAVAGGLLRWARYAERHRRYQGRGTSTTGAGMFSVAQFQEEQARAAAGDTPGRVVTYEDQIRLAADLVTRRQDASTAMLCRELGIGMLPAAGLLDELERRGVVGPAVGGRREVLVKPEPEDERPS